MNEFINTKTPLVTAKEGYNRFRWDLRHEGIVNKDKSKNIKGPFVKPGKYKVQVSVDQQFLISNQFSVIKDPNTDVSQNTLIELEKFQLDLLEKIKRAINIRNEIKKYKSKKGLSKAKREKFNKILDELETKDGNYMQPMLIDQLKYLYSMVNKADQVLGEDAYNRHKELSIQLEVITKKL